MLKEAAATREGAGGSGRWLGPAWLGVSRGPRGPAQLGCMGQTAGRDSGFSSSSLGGHVGAGEHVLYIDYGGAWADSLTPVMRCTQKEEIRDLLTELSREPPQARRSLCLIPRMSQAARLSSPPRTSPRGLIPCSPPADPRPLCRRMSTGLESREKGSSSHLPRTCWATRASS